ncbi:MAG: type II toxin-antitoxin system prevent-host-death family antitoxin [Gammaproteobacteria bacterium]|nr:type II toxin-antitoxin system prevent-host-death family antitoxin [Gammaproteobacteria bacterium]
MAIENKTDESVIKASEFKAKCLKLMDAVAKTGEELVITKNGEPVAKLVPYRDRPKRIFGIDRGSMRILGDIVEPLDIEWEAMRDDPNEHV